MDWQMNIIQEYCDGGSLFDALKRRGFPDSRSGSARGGGAPDQATFPFILSVASDIASGCAYIHGKQIVHGDLKPDNVLLKSRPSSPAAGNTALSICVAKVMSV